MNSATPLSEADDPPAELQRGRYRRTTGRVLVESLLIVASVLLGFALTNWQTARSRTALADATVAALREELAGNLAELESVSERHADFAQRLRTLAAQSPQRPLPDLLVDLMDGRSLSLPVPEDAAWETAVSTGALSGVPRETVQRLARAYRIQRAGVSLTSQRLMDRLFSMDTLDPDRRETAVTLLAMLFQELHGQEVYLLDEYRAALEETGGGG